MSFRIFTLLALFVAGATAAAAGTHAHTAACTGKVLKTETMTSPKGVKFELTTTQCTSTTSVHTRDILGVNLEAGMEKRDPRECTDPEICVCGAQCDTITCGASPVGTVKPADCQDLAEAILDTLAGTFFVSAGTTQSANFGSCEYIFANEADIELEYCWDDFAILSHDVSLDCPAEQAVCQGHGAAVFVAFA